MNSSNRELLFRETQQFRQPLLWCCVTALGIAVTGPVTYAMIHRLLLNDAGYASGFSDAAIFWGGLAIILTLLGFVGMLALARLTAEVWSDGVTIKYFPFHREELRITPQQIGEFQAKTFKTVRELRRNGGREIPRSNIFSLAGDSGVRLELADGQCYFIGTESPQQLTAAILYSIDPENEAFQGGCSIGQAPAGPPSN